MNDAPFAYSLAHAETGWAWRVLDEEGEIVASGLDLSRSDAEEAVEATIQRAAAEYRV
jgi:hypothetical protein